MKKILILLFMFTLLGSCDKKEISLCWTCITKVTTSYQGQSSTATTTTDYCQKSPDDIRQIEKNGTYSSTTTGGGVTIHTNATTYCNQK